MKRGSSVGLMRKCDVDVLDGIKVIWVQIRGSSANNKGNK